MCATAAAPVAQRSYVLVAHKLGSESGTSAPAEINRTPTYATTYATLKSAAIRMPDNCLNDTAAAVMGKGSSVGTATIAQTVCGVWLGEIERALTLSGFKVISWDALRQLEKQKGLSTYVAATQLGADVVFVFNSLDARPIPGGAKQASEFRYFSSDEVGSRGNAFSPDDTQRAFFKEFIKKRVGIGDASVVDVDSAILDVTANLTSTGEAIWFYRRAVTKPKVGVQRRRFLFAGEAGKWWPVAPNLPDIPDSPKASSGGAVDTDSDTATPGGSADLELVRMVARDFVTRFRGGA